MARAWCGCRCSTYRSPNRSSPNRSAPSASAPRALITPRAALVRAAREHGVWQEPRGFIFHMSRCGSTALAQAVNADPEVILIAEAQPINASLAGAWQRPPDAGCRESVQALMALY